MARSQHALLFARLIAERRQELLESMTVGHEPSVYMRLVGQVQGLDDAVKISDEADFKISGEITDASN